MSLTINRFGGGSGVSESNAILMVHVPTGSTVTASKGGVTLIPKTWVSGSTVDEDVAMFIFSSAQFDANTPWTITATDGTNTSSDTVLITTNKEYEAKLAYYLSLFDRTKDSFATIASGFRKSANMSLSDYSATYIKVTGLGNYNPSGSWITPLPSDLSQYTTLDVCVYGSNDVRNKIGVTSTIVENDTSDTWIAASGIPTDAGSVVHIPVTSAMAGAYFTMRINGGKTFFIQYARII